MYENRFQARKCASMKFRILHYILLFRLKRLFKEDTSFNLFIGEVYSLKDTKKFDYFGFGYKDIPCSELYNINSIYIDFINPKNTDQVITFSIINESKECSFHEIFNTSTFKREFLFAMKYTLISARRDWVKHMGNCNYVKMYIRDNSIDSYIMPVQNIDIRLKDFAECINANK